MESDSGNYSTNEPQTGAAIKLDALSRLLPDLLICMDSSGRILSYKTGKPASLYLFPEQFVGQQIQDILPHDIGLKLSRAIQAAIQTGNVVSMDYQLPVPNGQRWFEAHLVSSVDEIIAILCDVTDRVTTAEQVHRQLQRLSALHSIEAAVTSSFDLNVIMSVVLRKITGQLGVDAADILLLSQPSHRLEFAAGHGFLSPTFQHEPVMIGKGYAGIAALERRTVSVPTLD